MAKRALVFVGLFALGVLYRMLIISISPQPFWFDQFEYHQFALGILSHGLFYVESSRTYGYPLVIALLYALLGTGHVVWQLFTMVIDTTTAFVLYAAAKRLTRSNAAGGFALVITLFNPFTAPYTGMLLTEVLSVFLMACILLFFILWLHDPKKSFVYVLAALLGFLPQVRPGFLYFDIAVVGYILWRQKTAREGVGRILLTALLFLFWFVYPIIGNYRTYGVFSATTVDNFFSRELYISLQVTSPSPHPANSTSVFPVSVQQIYEEYSKTKTNSQRRAMANKYWNMSIARVRSDPVGFFTSRIAKFWYVWQKTYMYYFTDEPSWRRMFMYWLNIGYLALAAVGSLLLKTRGKVDPTVSRFIMVSACLILYIAAVHSMTLAEERYSLPGYPVIWIFAGYGAAAIIQAVNRRR